MRIETVILAMDHNPLDLTKKKEGGKEEREEGRKEGKQKKIPLKLNHLLGPPISGKEMIIYAVA